MRNEQEAQVAVERPSMPLGKEGKREEVTDGLKKGVTEGLKNGEELFVKGGDAERESETEDEVLSERDLQLKVAYEELKSSLRGDAVSMFDKSTTYDQAKEIWNGDWTIINKPRYVIHCRGVSDVSKTVKFARATGLPATVRCGGHSLNGLSTCVNGVVIDLGKYMRSVRVNPQKKEVWFEGGCRVKDVDEENEMFQLCTVLGAVGSAGVGGLVTGGGLGYFTRKEGLAVDNVLSVDVIDANGEFLHANAEENPDLFWAVRGGQSNFGIVTSFRMRLVDMPPMVLGGMVLFEFKHAHEVVKKYLEFTSDELLPRECSAHLYSLSLGDEDDKYLSLQICYLGDPDEGRKAFSPLLSGLPILMDQTEARTYTEYQKFSDEVYRVKGVPSYWRSRNVKKGTPIPVDSVVECIKMSPPEGVFVMEHYGGKVWEYAGDATAYPHREVDRVITFNGFGYQSEEARERVKVLKEAFDGSSYTNYDGGSAQSSFAANLPRLRKIKKIYDPDNFFRCNSNVLPEDDTEKTGAKTM